MDQQLVENFAMYVEKEKELPESVPKKERDELYGLRMQFTYGGELPVRPGLYNRRDPQKWDAWNAQREKSKVEAMNEFANKVNELREAYAG